MNYQDPSVAGFPAVEGDIGRRFTSEVVRVNGSVVDDACYYIVLV